MTLSRFETGVTDSIDNAVKEIHTALPGTILSFNSSNQTCEVQIDIQRIFLGTKIVTIPPLINAPLAIWKAGGFAITFPIEPGDQCLVIFSERSLDSWLSNGSIAPPLHRRTHDLSDGVVFPCLSSANNSISSYNSTDLVIESLTNGTSISLTEAGNVDLATQNATLTLKQNGGINLTNTSSGQSLFDLLVSLCNYLSMEPQLIYGAQYAAIKANLQTFGP